MDINQNPTGKKFSAKTEAFLKPSNLGIEPKYSPIRLGGFQEILEGSYNVIFIIGLQEITYGVVLGKIS
jgi:hypothetical protein